MCDDPSPVAVSTAVAAEHGAVVTRYTVSRPGPVMSTWEAIRGDLRAARKRKGWTLTTLAAQVGVSPSSMGQRERGTVSTSMEVFLRWIVALDVTVTLGPPGYTPATPMLLALAAHLDQATATMVEILVSTCGVPAVTPTAITFDGDLMAPVQPS